MTHTQTKLIYIFSIVILLAVIICYYSEDEVIATFSNGVIYKKHFFDEINHDEFDNLNRNIQHDYIREFVVKEILFTQIIRKEKESDLAILDNLTRINNNKLMKTLFDHLDSQFEISDSLVNSVYKAMQQEYTFQDITITHNLSYTPINGRLKSKAKQISDTIYKRIINKEITFDEAVSIYVEVPSIKINNGILGPMQYGKLPYKLNNAIWSSRTNDIIGPIESKFGFHIFKIIKHSPVDTVNKPHFSKRNIQMAIKQGKYGIREAHANKFAREIFKEFNITIHYDEIGNLYDLIDNANLFEIPNGIPIQQIKDLNFSHTLVSINKKHLNFEWIFNEASRHGNFKETKIVGGYFLKKFIYDLVMRHVGVKWVEQSELFNHELFQSKIVNKQKLFLYKSMIDNELEINPTLTKDVIVNRFLIKNNVQINY